MRITAIALAIGALPTVAAKVLLLLIRFFTELFFYQRPSRSDLIKVTLSLHAEEHERQALRSNPLALLRRVR